MAANLACSKILGANNNFVEEQFGTLDEREENDSVDILIANKWPCKIFYLSEKVNRGIYARNRMVD
jgi:hypothetical protein